MTQMVALLHTSFALLGKDRMLFDLIDEILPGVELVNIIEDTMLKEVRSIGYATPPVVRRMCLYAMAAEAMGVDAIFSVCSSLGRAADVASRLVSTPLVRIDEAMAEEAAAQGRRLAVMATVPTTLEPTVGLIEEKAAGKGRSIETRSILCEGAFDLLMSGQAQAHDDMIARKAAELVGWADALVMAQSTMTRLAPRLTDETGLPVWTSPRLGVEHLKRVLEARKPQTTLSKEPIA